MTSDDSAIPIEGPLSDADVIDSEFQQVDLGNNNNSDAAADTLFKLDSLFKADVKIDAEKSKSPKRRTVINVLAALVAVVMLICLIATLQGGRDTPTASPKNSANEGKQTEDDSQSKSNRLSPTCSSTILTCPLEKTGSAKSWSQLPDDVLGDSALSYTGFATALSCDGSIMAVSAPQSDTHTGHVRVFKWDVEIHEWNVVGADIKGSSQFDEFGDAIALSADGTRLAIGSQYNDDGGKDAGHVRVFDYVDFAWVQVGKDIYGENNGDQSGTSVTLSADGSRLAIGATNNNATASGAGHVRVYSLDASGASWKQLGNDIDGEHRGDQSGRAVALSGNGKRVAIGGHTNDGDNDSDSGHVRIFEFSDETRKWTQVGKDLNGEPGDSFGISVTMSFDGSRVAAGAPGKENAFNSKSRVYELLNGKWVQMGFKLDGGGNSIAMTRDGNRVITGSYNGFHNGYRSGLAVVYDYNGTGWTQVGSDLHGAMGEYFGTAVAISGDGNRIASSAPGAHIGGVAAFGAVRVFDLC